MKSCTATSARILPGNGGSPFCLDVDFAVGAGFTILFGASGAGKTTLLDCIAGLETPESGRIALGETVLFDSDARAEPSAEPSQRRLPAADRWPCFLI